MSKQGLSVKKPVSAWNKPLKADFRTLFKALSKMAVHGYAGDWTKAAIDACDALSVIGFAEDAGQTAWLLIRRALTRATFELASEKADRMRPGDHLDTLADEIDLSIEETELVIDAGFFDRPRDLAILDAIRKPFEGWLVGTGLEAAQAAGVVGRLDSYFVFSLADEWRRRVKDYQVLEEALETPFAGAEQREQAWMQYSAWLEKQIDEPMFDEPFSLRQVYVQLPAYWEEKIKDDGREPERLGGHDERNVRRHVVDLEEELTAWVDKADPKDAIRVVSGGPGSGKSSFTKVFAAHIAVLRTEGVRRVLSSGYPRPSLQTSRPLRPAPGPP